MALSAQDRFQVAQNLIAKYGGLENIDLRAELAKAESRLNQMNQLRPPESSYQPGTAPIAPPMGVDTTQPPISPQNGLNEGISEGVNEGENMVL